MDRRVVALLVGATVLGLGGALATKEWCTTHDWVDFNQYRNYCYSDLLPLWFGKHLDQDKVPYLEEPNEYPVLTGMYMYGAAAATTSLVDYMHLSMAGLLVCGAAATWALSRSGMSPQRLLAWALGPPLVLHGLANWDLLAVMLAGFGWLAWRRGKAMDAALWFGLGGAAKLYPAFFLPYLLLDAVQAKDRRKALQVIAGGAVGLGLPNLVIAVRAWTNWVGIWTFHAARGLDFETPWDVLRALVGAEPSAAWTHTASALGLLAIAASAGLLAWWQWRRRLGPMAPLVAGTALTAAFLLFNRVYSPQYTLWVVPFLLLLGVPWSLFWAYVATDALNVLVRWPLLAMEQGSAPTPIDPYLHPASHVLVLVRWTFLAACTWAVVKAARTARAPENPP